MGNPGDSSSAAFLSGYTDDAVIRHGVTSASLYLGLEVPRKFIATVMGKEGAAVPVAEAFSL